MKQVFWREMWPERVYRNMNRCIGCILEANLEGQGW